MAELSVEQKKAIALAKARQRLQQGTGYPVKYGTLWPTRRDGPGLAGLHFDPSAGILGAAKRAITLPGEVMRGEVDPMSEEGLDRALETAAFMNPVSTATRAGVGFAGAPVTKRLAAKTPSAQALHETATAGFDNMRKTGAEYPGEAVGQFARGLRATLEKDGILDELAPQSFAILKKLEKPPEGSVATIQGMAAARRALKNARQNFNNPTDQEAARRILSGLDSFIETASSRSAVAGPAAAQREAARLLRESNANYAAAKRSSRLTGVEAAAGLRASAANSGQNTGNAIRQRIASVLLSPKKLPVSRRKK